MKRKLWILLALAALSALIAGAALADGHRFVTQPQGGSIDPDTLSFTVSWETDFVPLRVEVMRIEYVEGTGKDFFGNTITVTREKPVRENTLTAGMARQMSYTTWAMKVDEPYRLFAYYGTGAEDYVSSEIYRPDDSALVFTTQPASGSYNPESL